MFERVVSKVVGFVIAAIGMTVMFHLAILFDHLWIFDLSFPLVALPLFFGNNRNV